mmetsp:Transcript_18277/g.56040  ORF Transcript_18277/g.56040 Transcript_18277/m.56040 type:complete len:207 (+) Transcript_18277:606-1226(+)
MLRASMFMETMPLSKVRRSSSFKTARWRLPWATSFWRASTWARRFESSASYLLMISAVTARNRVSAALALRSSREPHTRRTQAVKDLAAKFFSYSLSATRHSRRSAFAERASSAHALKIARFPIWRLPSRNRAAVVQFALSRSTIKRSSECCAICSCLCCSASVASFSARAHACACSCAANFLSYSSASSCRIAAIIAIVFCAKYV